MEKPGNHILAILILITCLSSLSCREPEGPVYPDEGDLDIYPGGSLDFDPGVDFQDPKTVPEDTSEIPPLCPDYTKRLFNNNFSPFLGGDSSVDLEIISFSYFGCPHCALWAETYEEIWNRRKDFRDRVRIYFHHYPFSNVSAYQFHAAAHAAGIQKSTYFWAVHNFIYSNMLNNTPVSIEDIEKYVESELDLDFDKWMNDKDSDTNPNMYNYLDWDKSQAAALGITGVPAIFICGVDINDYPGGRSNVEEIVDSFLE